MRGDVRRSRNKRSSIESEAADNTTNHGRAIGAGSRGLREL